MKIDLFLYLVILFLIVAMVIGYFIMKDEGVKCLSNPIQFGVSGLEEQSGAVAMCVCSINDNDYLPFIVTKNTTLPLAR